MGFLPSNVRPSVQPYHEANQPRSEVVIDGNTYKLESYSISLNAHGATNTANVTLTITKNPDFTLVLYRDVTNPVPVYIQINTGFNGQMTTRFKGVVDQYVVHTDATNYTVEFQCRSAASVLVDNKVTTNAIGLGSTSVDFLQQQCARFGLQYQYYLPNGYTPITIGQVFRGTFQYGIKNLRIWDLLIQCAQFDDVDVWEENGTVFYANPAAPQLSRQNVTLTWLQDVESIVAIHAPNFNRNVEVVVRTYKPRTKQSTSARTKDDGFGNVTTTTVSRTSTVTQGLFGSSSITSKTYNADGTVSYSTTSSTATGGAASGSSGGTVTETKKERYVIYVPNQDAAIAQNIANNMWRQISMHEYSVTVQMPVTTKNMNSIGIRSYITIANHPYQLFNTKYWPRRITEDFNTSEGWRYTIEAVNHVPPLSGI